MSESALFLTLVATGFLMGIAGSPHCLAMCAGPATWVLSTAREPGAWTSWLLFNLGRMLGYALLGVLMAAIFAALREAVVLVRVAQPFWVMLHVVILVLALHLAVAGQQPRFIGQWAHAAVSRANRVGPSAAGEQVIRAPQLRSKTTAWNRPVFTGMLWAFMPCGLLYAGLLTAALSNNLVTAGATMLAFGAGTSVTLMAVPAFKAAGANMIKRSFLARLNADGRLGGRLAGAALAALSGWILFAQATNRSGGLFCF
ncbi:MAG: sulfite exporter TauE/SafE family protein [Burkholderiaceae bacterium]